MKILMIDVGGSHVKLMATPAGPERKFDSHRKMSAGEMVEKTLTATRDWDFEAVSVGYPGLVRDAAPAAEPANLGTGWVRFDYTAALGRPVRIINDAALQALAAYESGRMLFLGLGTGLASALVVDDVIVPLELGLLEFSGAGTLVESLSNEGVERLERERWHGMLHRAVQILHAAFLPDEIVLGGGNASLLDPLPPGCSRRKNSDAYLGAMRLWGDDQGLIAEPLTTTWRIRRR